MHSVAMIFVRSDLTRPEEDSGYMDSERAESHLMTHCNSFTATTKGMTQDFHVIIYTPTNLFGSLCSPVVS